MKANRLIGLDFDNTIVVYDQLFAELGRDAGLLPTGFVGSKDQARVYIRALPDGEAQWTKLQATVYGPGIRHAFMAPGLGTFLSVCRARGCDIAIVSHKTEFAAADQNTNLRATARAWIVAQNLAGTVGAPIADTNIYFESTRDEKIARIAQLGCDCFIDDLEEVFAEPSFPHHVERHLIKLGAALLPVGPFRAWRSWADIQRYLFDDV